MIFLILKICQVIILMKALFEFLHFTNNSGFLLALQH